MGMHETATGRVGGGGGGSNKSCFSVGWGLVAKVCDYCNCAAALLFCRTDSAFMCMECDSKLHVATDNNKLGTSKHERVWMCEVCEQAPASVTCKADAAALCVTCDRDIHSANPLARRHERSPVVPFYDTAESVVKSTAAAAATTFLAPPMSGSDYNNSFSDNNQQVVVTSSPDHDDIKLATRFAHDGYVTDPWISSLDPTASRVPADAPDIKSMEFLFSDSDNNYLDFDYPISSDTRFHQHYGSGTDGVVPVQTIKPPIPAELPPPCNNSTEKHFEIDFTKSQISSYNNSYNPQSISHSVSSSSLDVGVVPDGSCISEISYSYGRSMSSNALELNGSTGGSQTVGMDREARVLRYREKRKNRKFEKTIRYASRKAYAETRPRIKGRFAKRNDQVESDHNIRSTIDMMFSPTSATSSSSASAFFTDSRFGVVPSF